MSTLEKEIYALECSHLKPDVRVSAEKIGDVLDVEFFEFGSSGGAFKRVDYNGDHPLNPDPMEIKFFTIHELGPAAVLTTYQVHNHKTGRLTNRSSVWKKRSNGWKLFFIKERFRMETCLNKRLRGYSHNSTIIGEGGNDMEHAIVLFDGDCNFCDSSVQFIINHDPAGYYQFASLQSEIGKELSNKHNVPDDVDSLVLIKDGQAYVKSEGALMISNHLTGLWKLAHYLKPFPRALRDGAYDVIAKNRYKVFGKLDSCMLPPPHIRKRFLDK